MVYMANNNLNLSGKYSKQDKSWTSAILQKKAEKEPTKVLENLAQFLRTDKDSMDTNQKTLEEKRIAKDLTDLFEKQNEKNVVNKHHYADGINETQLNNTDGARNEDFYTSGLSLFTKEVFPKMRERAKMNKEFYDMKENKDRVGEGDVVSAGAKIIKVVTAQDLYSSVGPELTKVEEMVKQAGQQILTGDPDSAKATVDSAVVKLNQISEWLMMGNNGDVDAGGLEIPQANIKNLRTKISKLISKIKQSNKFKEVKVVKSQYEATAPSVSETPMSSPSELQMTSPSSTTTSEPVQTSSPQQEQTQPVRQRNDQVEKKETEENENAPKKHSLRYWNHTTKEWKTLAESDDADELEDAKERAIKQYYNGSQHPGKNAPFEIFVNEHPKTR